MITLTLAQARTIGEALRYAARLADEETAQRGESDESYEVKAGVVREKITAAIDIIDRRPTVAEQRMSCIRSHTNALVNTIRELDNQVAIMEASEIMDKLPK